MISVLRNIFVTLLAIATLTACAAKAPVTVDEAWANATPVGASVAAVYLQIAVNEADTLLSATTTVADRIEMHTSSEENGMTRMRPLPAVPLQPGKPFVFAPGGAHFMLLGLRQPLMGGMRFPMTLRFERAGALNVQVQVVEPGSRQQH